MYSDVVEFAPKKLNNLRGFTNRQKFVKISEMGNHKLRVFTSLCERVAAVASACILVLSLLIAPRVFASSEETSASSNGVDHFVTIHDQGTKYSVRTDALTVGEVLERAEISVGEHDTVEPAVEAAVSSDNFQINIYRARPVVVVDGAVSTYAYSTAYSPKEVAQSVGFTIYDGDEVEVSATSTQQFLETGAASVYTITRNGGRTVTVEEVIPYDEEIIDDYELEAGVEQVEQVGEDGVRTLTYEVNFVDGVEVSRQLVSSEVTREPVPKIKRVGRAYPVVPGSCEDWILQAGVSRADLQAALTLINRESGCRPTATNSSSGAYGIPQALPGSKMASMGSDWRYNPVTQIRWMDSYVKGRYGGWSQALAHSYSKGWY